MATGSPLRGARLSFTSVLYNDSGVWLAQDPATGAFSGFHFALPLPFTPGEAGARERMLDRREMGRALGRGPPCSVCGHVCHMSYVHVSLGVHWVGCPPW